MLTVMALKQTEFKRIIEYKITYRKCQEFNTDDINKQIIVSQTYIINYIKCLREPIASDVY